MLLMAVAAVRLCRALTPRLIGYWTVLLLLLLLMLLLGAAAVQSLPQFLHAAQPGAVTQLVVKVLGA
jgi:hypothetical protein